MYQCIPTEKVIPTVTWRIAIAWVVLWNQAYSQGVHLTYVHLDYNNTLVLVRAGGNFSAVM